MSNLIDSEEEISERELRAAINTYRDIVETRNKRRERWGTVLGVVFTGWISLLFPFISTVFWIGLAKYEISEDFWTGAVSATCFLVAWALIFTLIWRRAGSDRI